MKKIIAALLVLTMVLALTGSALADHLCAGDYVKFKKNAYAYSEPKSSKKIDDPYIIVSKGSYAKVIAKKGDYVFLQLTPGYYSEDLGNTYEVESGLWAWGYWFKTSDLSECKTEIILVRFSNGGNGKSKPTGDIVEDTVNVCKDHVKADAKVWMHKTPSLSNSYGRALHKGDKVKYRHLLGTDTRGVVFYGIRYKGKCLWVSCLYTHLVK